MTAHIAAGAAPTTVFPAAPGWMALSAALGDEVPVIADRDDLLVTIAPGAGRGAPACFIPDQAAIEIDGAHLGTVDPATAAPHRAGDRARYATAWGLLTHECAHAAHTRWQAPPGTPPGAAAAALLLEESRIEAAQIRRRPEDRYWLRASATHLILAELSPGTGSRATGAGLAARARAVPTTPQDAARTAALLLARADAGILTRTETATVTRAVTPVLGADTLAALRGLWRAAQTTADTDAEAMIELGRRWCEALGTDPADPAPEATGEQAPGRPSPLGRALARAAAAIARAKDPAPGDPAARATKTAAENTAARDAARTEAGRVFAPGGPSTPRSPIAGTRAPTSAERTAARHLGRTLSTAGSRERTPARTTAATPPGRLRMRGALAAEAQRAAGAVPTAEPFTRTTRTTVATPPLRLGVACDVSGSMHAFTAPVASAAWILAHAARHTRVPATTATVTFSAQVHPITHPGTAPREVTEFRACGTGHAIDTAITALDGALDLSRADAARLLVIVSDGVFGPTRTEAGQAALDRLRATGCAVLWLTPDDPGATPLRGARVHTLTDPAATARAIGQAATAAMRTRR
ncbi:VWA domain containing CoxE-like protein [Murinocardiopsis flavida]|uniref:VWA domain containing CoxE-like protein n=1 Tax=Murinocardiopsis flavida TaxID=645275 RepID=A0A2P8DG19_9ACTN|nr:VWA domain-containing protein [Murinocardiopsis flavida]PSK96149.1 VWA domain containing CoxE-like protein [Murinocardiopsis flavida]